MQRVTGAEKRLDFIHQEFAMTYLLRNTQCKLVREVSRYIENECQKRTLMF